jgi:hypothetical protein
MMNAERIQDHSPPVFDFHFFVLHSAFIILHFFRGCKQRMANREW